MAQNEIHELTVMLSDDVVALTKARPEEPSAIQAVEAVDHPDGKFMTLAVRSEVSDLTPAVLTNKVKALGPPQKALLAPAQTMLHWVEGSEREAPLVKIPPQKH